MQDDAGELVINVSLETDRIADVTLEPNPQLNTDFVSSFEVIRSRILDANSPHVDAVTGATTQSEAVKKRCPKRWPSPARRRLWRKAATRRTCSVMTWW